MSIAERTREAVDRHPFLVEALRAGVVNFTAAARFLDIGDTDAVAAALRRYADELPERDHSEGSIRLRMTTGIGRTTGGDEPLIRIGDRGFVPETGELTAIVAEGDIDAGTVATALWRLAVDGTPIEALASDSERLFVVTERSAGSRVLRVVESAFDPDPRD